MAGTVNRMGSALARTLAGVAAGTMAALGAAEPLRLAVASNFHHALAAVEAGYPGEIVASYGSSGLLYAQVVQGRPFDIFLSADAARPQALVDDNKAKAPVTYATGRLVLLVGHGTPGAAWLSADKRVALANPDTAPYGRAAVEAMSRLGVKPERITALNVAQAFHFAASGAADGAFAALAQMVAQDIPAERYWVVPEDLYAPIEQVAVVLDGPNETAARAFLDYLGGAEAQALIRQAGYR